MLFTGLVVLLGSLVRGLLVMFFGRGLCIRALGVQFGMFMLSGYFGPCYFILFDSAL
jgi:hypothetical protein